ncbi:MAG: alpha/beta hydrolase [Bacteroidetes bacterium HGW-Bacteroidetes-14]|jgi:hypothetical protein|nr:MAG: alpha/beta hydrolase [Bacteroidetes bacterium HGW-Bacteroidetes-14]
MKRLIFSITAFILTTSMYAQEITGSWYGKISVQSLEMRLVFNISASDTAFTATMDSPDQGVAGIPATSVFFINPMIKIVIANAGIEYNGVFTGETILGTFRQGGMSVPMNLSRRAPEGPKRPQEPRKPYPYKSEEVTFLNQKDKIELAGTLTLPADGKPVAAVILVSGSGPQNRDEELVGHKPFLVISDYLTKRGIAVLRYDDRGVGKSKGKHSSATTFDFASDAYAAVEYLRNREEMKGIKIGIAGHSEGGIIAPLVAERDKELGFIILMAGPGVSGAQIIISQQRLIGERSGADKATLDEYESITRDLYKLIETEKDNPDIKVKLMDFFSKNAPEASEKQLEAQIAAVAYPWMITFVTHDPSETLTKLTLPVLAINGTNDLQVPYRENLGKIRSSLLKAHNNNEASFSKNVEIIEYDGLNHLFQHSETGLPAEYGKIEETISPDVLEKMASWIISKSK